MLIKEYQVVAGDMLQTPSYLVQVTIYNNEYTYWIIPIQSITSLAYLVFSKMEKKYFVNSHIDLTVYNEIY